MKASERGMTLVEVMVASVVAFGIVSGTFLIYMIGSGHSETSNVKMTIQDNARESLYEMVQEIRLSAPDRITISEYGDTITFDIPDVDNPLGTGFSVDWTNGTTVVYSVNTDNQLIRTNQTLSTAKILANNVTSVVFAEESANDDGDPAIVSATISVQRVLFSGRTIPATPLQVTGHAEIRNT